MDRHPVLRDALSVVVQRRHSYDLASLTLTPHYVRLSLDPAASPHADGAPDTNASELQGELPRTSIFSTQPGDAVTFSLHLTGHVTRLPSAPARSAQAAALFPSGRAFPLWIQLKDFESLTLYFADEQASRAVFDSLRSSTVLQSIEQLAAFRPGELPVFSRTAPDSSLDARAGPSGWTVYDAKKEFERQGVWSRTKAWRTTTLNARHAFCPTYPSLLVVPSRISDTTLQHGAKFRSKSRLPALTYLHWAHLGSITRSSQPLVGLRYSRSVQDEKLVDAIFTSHLFAGEAQVPPAGIFSSDEAGHTADSPLGAFDAIESSEAPTTLNNQSVYGAKPNNVIIDARPTTNAYANHAKGAGSETMDYYPGCTKVFLGIDNIHVMRDSLKAITEALADADVAPGSVGEGQELPELDPGQIKRSGWLKHTTTLLEGAAKIIRSVHIDRAHVLIHCSDGWDRTSQLSAVAQVCLDPYFRTFQGFAVLIEKDFASFGHRFLDRTGHLSHGSFFEDKFQASPDPTQDVDGRNGGFEAATAASALWGFTKSVAANLRGPQDQESVTHLKELSPVFHQFLDCVYQLHRQFPERFEFATGWLVELQRALHESTTGTFLFNSEAERILYRRRFPGLKSVWDDLLAPATKDVFHNTQYNPELESARDRTEASVLIPDGKDVRLWPALFRRPDRDLNNFIDAERAAQAQVAAERAARRKRLEQRLEAAAQGKPTTPSTDGGEGISLTGPADPDDYAGLAYRPYQPKSKTTSRSRQLTNDGSAAGRTPRSRDTDSSNPPTSDDWDPAAAGRRQVRALWSVGKGWLFGGEQASGSEEGNPWGMSSPMAATSASSVPVPRAPPTAALHNRNDSISSSWDANVWADPASDPLGADLQRLAVSASSPPPVAARSSHRSTGPAEPVLARGPLDPGAALGRRPLDPPPVAAHGPLDPAAVVAHGPLDPLGGSDARGMRHTRDERTGSVSRRHAHSPQPPLVHAMGEPLSGDPLGASWTRSSSATGTSRKPETPSEVSGQAGRPGPNAGGPPAREAHEHAGSSQDGGATPAIAARALASSDPLGVL